MGIEERVKSPAWPVLYLEQKKTLFELKSFVHPCPHLRELLLCLPILIQFIAHKPIG